MGELNLPVVNFDALNVTDELLKNYFLTKEEMDSLWQKEAWLAILGNDYDKAKQIIGDAEIDIFNNLISLFACEFTCFPRSEERLNIYLNLIKRAGEGRLISTVIKDDLFMFITTKGTITGAVLSSSAPCFKDWFPEIETVDRYGDCHHKAIKSSLKIDNNHYVVTGYISPFSKKCQNLHSWLEVEAKDGKFIVYDPSKNLMMNKRGYYLLNKIEKTYKIEKDELKKDVNVLDFLKKRNWLYIKLFLANRPLARNIYEQLQESCTGGENEE